MENQDTQAEQSGQSVNNPNERLSSPKAQSQRQQFRRIKDASSMVSELRDGDGIDPRIEHRKRQQSRIQEKPDYASARLASQIARCINANLDSNALSEFQVQSAVPGKGNSFVVTLSAVIPQLDYDPQIILLAATAMIPHFRSEIARDIHRKQVPNLKFLVAPSATSLEK